MWSMCACSISRAFPVGGFAQEKLRSFLGRRHTDVHAFPQTPGSRPIYSDGSRFKSFAQKAYGIDFHRRTIDQRNDGRIPPTIQHFAQADLQGTELSAAGIRIDDDRSGI